MLYYDMVSDVNSVNTITPNQSGASDTSQSGGISNIYDNNVSTNYFYYAHHGGDGSVDGYLTFDSTWTNAVIIQQLVVNGTIQMDGGNYFGARGAELDFYVQLKIGGVWTTISNTGAIANGKAGDGAQPYNWTPTINGPWSNVTGIRFYMHAFATSYEGNRNQYVWLYMNEVHCYRELLPEVLRIKKGSGVISIGGHAVSSADPLRISKSGVTMSIPLVVTTDPQASPIRVKTSAGIKALPLAG